MISWPHQIVVVVGKGGVRDMYPLLPFTIFHYEEETNYIKDYL
jgi:hypothetical protein